MAAQSTISPDTPLFGYVDDSLYTMRREWITLKALKRSASVRLAIPLALGSMLVVAGVVAIAPPAWATTSTPSPVLMGTASNFAVLAGQTVTNTGSTTISGSLGLYPGSAVTGLLPSAVSNGAIHVNDGVATQAQTDLTTAFNDAAGRTPTAALPNTDLGGQTFGAGVYASSTSLSITGNVTLNAQGNPDAVFIFQAGSTLITASGSSFTLAGNASACNVYWEVGSSATLGTNSSFTGTILALTSATVESGANVDGRILARNGAVALDSNVISTPNCTASTVTPPPQTPIVAPVASIATSVSAATVPLGGSVRDTATLTSSNPGAVPSGSVQFFTCGPGSTSCAPTQGSTLNSVTTLSNGVATSADFTPTTAGTYCFGVIYIPTSGTYQGATEVGSRFNGECTTFVATPTVPSATPAIPLTATTVPAIPLTATTVPAVPSSPPPTSVVVPPAHTGKPWSSSAYWLTFGISGLSGIVLIEEWVRRHRQSAS